MDDSFRQNVLLEYYSLRLSDRSGRGARPLVWFLERFPDAEARKIVCEEHAAGVKEAKTVARFQLVDELGRGGQGEVWLARDPDLDRVVALK